MSSLYSRLSAPFEEIGEFLFGKFQFAYIQAHRAAWNGFIAVGFVERNNRRIALDIYEISG